jgi:hypothetical protein
MSRLVIDDQRTFTGMEAVYARTLKEGSRLLYAQAWDEVYLDHDLSGKSTIMPLVVRLENDAFDGKPADVGLFIVHTSNSVGGHRMMQALSRGYNVVRGWVEEA